MMDATSILKSQGWRGAGHSLHPTDSSVGLSKPLLLPRKDNRNGVGQVRHHTSDQWWLHAFDQKLKGLDTSKNGVIVQTVTQGKLDSAAVGRGRYAGLYADFVSGGTMGGTLQESQDPTNAGEEHSRAAPNAVDAEEEGREEARARKRAKRSKRSKTSAEPWPDLKVASRTSNSKLQEPKDDERSVCRSQDASSDAKRARKARRKLERTRALSAS